MEEKVPGGVHSGNRAATFREKAAVAMWCGCCVGGAGGGFGLFTAAYGQGPAR